MRKIILPLFILLFYISALSQTSKSSVLDKLVVWSSDKSCDQQNSNVSNKNNLICDSFVINGSNIYTVNYNGLFYAISFVDNDKYLIVDVYVFNNTGKRVFVDIVSSGYVHYKTKEDFLAGKEPFPPGKAIPPENVANKILNRAMWANALAGIGTGFQTQKATVTTTDSKGNTSQSVVMLPDNQAKTETANQNVSRANSATQQSQNILDGALLSNTVFDTKSANGLVYFKRNKKAKFSLIFMKVDNISFVFQYN